MIWDKKLVPLDIKELYERSSIVDMIYKLQSFKNKDFLESKYKEIIESKFRSEDKKIVINNISNEDTLSWARSIYRFVNEPRLSLDKIHSCTIDESEDISWFGCMAVLNLLSINTKIYEKGTLFDYIDLFININTTYEGLVGCTDICRRDNEANENEWYIYKRDYFEDGLRCFCKNERELGFEKDFEKFVEYLYDIACWFDECGIELSFSLEVDGKDEDWCDLKVIAMLFFDDEIYERIGVKEEYKHCVEYLFHDKEENVDIVASSSNYRTNIDFIKIKDRELIDFIKSTNNEALKNIINYYFQLCCESMYLQNIMVTYKIDGDYIEIYFIDRSHSFDSIGTRGNSRLATRVEMYVLRNFISYLIKNTQY